MLICVRRLIYRMLSCMTLCSKACMDVGCAKMLRLVMSLIGLLVKHLIHRTSVLRSSLIAIMADYRACSIMTAHVRLLYIAVRLLRLVLLMHLMLLMQIRTSLPPHARNDWAKRLALRCILLVMLVATE